MLIFWVNTCVWPKNRELVYWSWTVKIFICWTSDWLVSLIAEYCWNWVVFEVICNRIIWIQVKAVLINIIVILDHNTLFRLLLDYLWRSYRTLNLGRVLEVLGTLSAGRYQLFYWSVYLFGKVGKLEVKLLDDNQTTRASTLATLTFELHLNIVLCHHHL